MNQQEFIDAYAKLGPYCPVCGSFASEFEMIPMTDDRLDGKIGCDVCCESYHMDYDNKKKIWRRYEPKDVESL